MHIQSKSDRKTTCYNYLAITILSADRDLYKEEV